MEESNRRATMNMRLRTMVESYAVAYTYKKFDLVEVWVDKAVKKCSCQPEPTHSMVHHTGKFIENARLGGIQVAYTCLLKNGRFESEEAHASLFMEEYVCPKRIGGD